MRKYGSFALCITYFFPVLRHVMPYVAGLNKMSYGRYALFSYTTGLVWTIAFFTLGRYVGDHAKDVGFAIYTEGLRFLWLPAVLTAIFVILRRRRAY
jgi:membrane protein DedA with SNARE-associated domain